MIVDLRSLYGTIPRTETSRHSRTWYLLEELNGISAIFLFLRRNSVTCPMDSSTHFSRADSDASPLHSLEENRQRCRTIVSQVYTCTQILRSRKGNVLFNDTLNTFQQSRLRRISVTLPRREQREMSYDRIASLHMYANIEI